ncbi:hypothetical protein ACHWQZ_G006278 [Mnemiopsis leidyi]
MLHKILKVHSLFAVSYISYIYLISGFIVNFLQLLTFLFIRTVSDKWGTKINGYLQAFLFAIFTFVVEWHCKCNIRFFSHPEDMKNRKREHCLCICNHRGEVDWLLGYTLLERLNVLEGCKCLIKKEAMYLPVIGWKMWFSDYMFLSRRWDTDQQIIKKTCKTWSNYDPHFNNNFYVLFAEGTRFTPAKHEASVKFCEERGIEPFRNVLYPRTKGAVELISQLGDTLGCVYDVVFAYPGNKTPGTWTMFAGQSTDVDIYFRRIDTANVPKKDKEAISDFIVQQFRDKDSLLDYHRKHQRFPGEQMSLPKRNISLILFYIWSFLTVTPGFLSVYYLIVNQCFYMLAVLGFICVLGGWISHTIISAANVQKSAPNATEKQKGA